MDIMAIIPQITLFVGYIFLYVYRLYGFTYKNKNRSDKDKYKLAGDCIRDYIIIAAITMVTIVVLMAIYASWIIVLLVFAVYFLLIVSVLYSENIGMTIGMILPDRTLIMSVILFIPIYVIYDKILPIGFYSGGQMLLCGYITHVILSLLLVVAVKINTPSKEFRAALIAEKLNYLHSSACLLHPKEKIKLNKNLIKELNRLTS